MARKRLNFYEVSAKIGRNKNHVIGYMNARNKTTVRKNLKVTIRMIEQ